jgi:hypothetical protein
MFRYALVHSPPGRAQTILGGEVHCDAALRRMRTLDPLRHRGADHYETIPHAAGRYAPADHNPQRYAAGLLETIPHAADYRGYAHLPQARAAALLRETPRAVHCAHSDHGPPRYAAGHSETIPRVVVRRALALLPQPRGEALHLGRPHCLPVNCEKA